MSLVVEEVACNTITHGFTKDGKPHSINVRVIKKDDLYSMRIRDDCPIYDPVKQLKLCSDEDAERHFGLRMISKQAKDIQYTNILKLNNLLIKI